MHATRQLIGNDAGGKAALTVNKGHKIHLIISNRHKTQSIALSKSAAKQLAVWLIENN